MRPTTRIAPTPSGYLHMGNAVNFVLTHWWARAHGARLGLRIDDFDTGRTRREYLDDVFETIRWLGIEIGWGPRDAADFLSGWSMQRHVHSGRRARDLLLSTRPDVVFVCRCSRTQVDASGRCAKGCQQAGLPFRPGATVVRLSVRPGSEVPINGTRTSVPPGDHVLWRRDDVPAYHLGSVMADEDLGTTTIVRGADLIESSALQVHLAGLLPAPRFLSAELLHHGLLIDSHGLKLSKSSGAQAQPMRRDRPALDRVRDMAVELGLPLGISPG